MRHIPVNGVRAAGRGVPIPWNVVQSTQGLQSHFAKAGLREVLLVRGTNFELEADPTHSTRIWLAMENLQITGSFKVRGAFCALQKARARGTRGVVAASAGNHGAGVAFAAGALGMEATVVVPTHAPRAKVDRMRHWGARMVSVQGGYDEAEVAAWEIAKSERMPMVSAYDDVDVLAGNGATLAVELVKALGRVPDRVLLPIGGGGLATGVAWGLSFCAGDDPREVRRVWTAQSEQSPAFALSIERRRPVEALQMVGKTLAEGLEGGISASAFARASAVVDGVTVVSEEHIAEAMRVLSSAMGVRVEGSAAVALVPVLTGLPGHLRGGDLVVVLTGRNVDDEVFDRVVGGREHW